MQRPGPTRKPALYRSGPGLNRIPSRPGPVGKPSLHKLALCPTGFVQSSVRSGKPPLPTALGPNRFRQRPGPTRKPSLYRSGPRPNRIPPRPGPLRKPSFPQLDPSPSAFVRSLVRSGNTTFPKWPRSQEVSLKAWSAPEGGELRWPSAAFRRRRPSKGGRLRYTKHIWKHHDELPQLVSVFFRVFPCFWLHTSPPSLGWIYTNSSKSIFPICNFDFFCRSDFFGFSYRKCIQKATESCNLITPPLSNSTKLTQLTCFGGIQLH